MIFYLGTGFYFVIECKFKMAYINFVLCLISTENNIHISWLFAYVLESGLFPQNAKSTEICYFIQFLIMSIDINGP